MQLCSGYQYSKADCSLDVKQQSINYKIDACQISVIRREPLVEYEFIALPEHASSC